MRTLAPNLGRAVTRAAAACLLAACSTTTTTTRPGAPGVAEMQGTRPSDFTFAFPAGARYEWTERRRFELAVAGTPVVARDESELRWEVAAHPSSFGTTVIDQRLVSVRLAHDGTLAVDGAPRDAQVQLVVDSGGNLQDVRGIEQVSRAVEAIATPGREGLVARLFAPEALRALVVARHDLLLGDVIFRPTAAGTTWIVPARQDGAALLRRYTVEGPEPCDGSMCERLRVTIPLDPRALDDAATALLERDVAVRGGPPVAPAFERSRYVMTGTVLVQPATLLPFGARMQESGNAIVVEPGGARHDVQLRATTEDTYRYSGTQPVAIRSTSLQPGRTP